MGGITDLNTLLAYLRPHLQEGEFVFCTLPGAAYGAGAEHRPVAAIAEEEGLTLILPREHADAAGLSYEESFRMLTPRVHSSLTAIGITAAVTMRLAERGISSNVVAAFYHDHIFVPSALARKAVEALEELAAEFRGASEDPDPAA
jgi:hypothetical protein